MPYCGEDVEHHAALDEVVECDGAAPRPVKLANQQAHLSRIHYVLGIQRAEQVNTRSRAMREFTMHTMPGEILKPKFLRVRQEEKRYEIRIVYSWAQAKLVVPHDIYLKARPSSRSSIVPELSWS